MSLVRTSDASPERLFAAAVRALGQMRPAETVAAVPARTADATFRVFFFLDDVRVEVVPHGTGAALRVRSRSRFGREDLGVNARRVRSLLRRISDTAGPLR